MSTIPTNQPTDRFPLPEIVNHTIVDIVDILAHFRQRKKYERGRASAVTRVRVERDLLLWAEARGLNLGSLLEYVLAELRLRWPAGTGSMDAVTTHAALNAIREQEQRTEGFIAEIVQRAEGDDGLRDSILNKFQATATVPGARRAKVGAVSWGMVAERLREKGYS